MSSGDLELATLATLEALVERLALGEPFNAAALRTRGIAEYLKYQYAGVGERFSLNEFFGRVRQRVSVEFLDAVDPARVVIKVLSEAIISDDIYIYLLSPFIRICSVV